MNHFIDSKFKTFDDINNLAQNCKFLIKNFFSRDIKSKIEDPHEKAINEMLSRNILLFKIFNFF